jgi:hypothetical protein
MTNTALTCPHSGCGIKVSLPCVGESEVIPVNEEGVHDVGEQVTWGHCPNCQKLIVLLWLSTTVTEEFGGATHFLGDRRWRIIEPRSSSRAVTDKDIPERFRKDFNEAAAVFPTSAKASAAISRRILQDVLHEHYQIKKHDLAQEIQEFLALSGLPTHLSEAVDAVRHLGNFAAHPLKSTDTGQVQEVEPGEAEWLLDVLEAVFDFAFVQPAVLARKKTQLNKRLIEVGKKPMK